MKVVIADPETKGHCADSHLGEVGGRHVAFPEKYFFGIFTEVFWQENFLRVTL